MRRITQLLDPVVLCFLTGELCFLLAFIAGPTQDGGHSLNSLGLFFVVGGVILSTLRLDDGG